MANAGPNTNGSQCGARGGMSLPARASPRRATWRQADRARCHRAGSSCAWPRRRGWTASMWRAAYPTLSHPVAGRSTCAVACVALCTAAPGGRAGARAPARRAGRAPTARPRRAGVWAGRVGLRRRARRGGLRQPRRGDIAGRGDRGRGRPAPGRRCGGPARCQPRRLGRHAWSQCACTSACACSGAACDPASHARWREAEACALSLPDCVSSSSCCACVYAWKKNLGSPVTAATALAQLLLTAAVSPSIMRRCRESPASRCADGLRAIKRCVRTLSHACLPGT